LRETQSSRKALRHTHMTRAPAGYLGTYGSLGATNDHRDPVLVPVRAISVMTRNVPTESGPRGRRASRRVRLTQTPPPRPRRAERRSSKEPMRRRLLGSQPILLEMCHQMSATGEHAAFRPFREPRWPWIDVDPVAWVHLMNAAHRNVHGLDERGGRVKR
jgi:hypothetical protein